MVTLSPPSARWVPWQSPPFSLGACRRLLFYHQFGGLGCPDETLVGYGVAVPPNLQGSEPLRRLREAWFESQGEPITQPELQEWHKALGGPESSPPLELRLGGALGLGRPRIIYLWGNSD